MIRWQLPDKDCPHCGERFTKTGLKLHKGSQRCANMTQHFPIKEKAKAEEARLRAANKVPVSKQTALAVERRGMGEFCGLESAESKVIDNNGYGPLEVITEYWLYEWVHKKWFPYKKACETHKFYVWLEKVKRMSEEERQAEIGMVLLSQVDD